MKKQTYVHMFVCACMHAVCMNVYVHMCTCVRQGTERKQLEAGASEKTWLTFFEVVKDLDTGGSEGKRG